MIGAIGCTGGSRAAPSSPGASGRPAAPVAIAAGLLLAVTAPLLANGGTVRISRQPVGPYLVSVMSSPTPLRTGEVDISVLIQDAQQEVVPGVPVVVEATHLGDPPLTLTHPATRQQATNKFFIAAKFDVPHPGEWEFRVDVGGDDEGGTVSFRADVTEPSILDRPYLLALLILAPLLLGAWLLGRRESGDPERA